MNILYLLIFLAGTLHTQICVFANTDVHYGGDGGGGGGDTDSELKLKWPLVTAFANNVAKPEAIVLIGFGFVCTISLMVHLIQRKERNLE